MIHSIQIFNSLDWIDWILTYLCRYCTMPCRHWHSLWRFREHSAPPACHPPQSSPQSPGWSSEYSYAWLLHPIHLLNELFCEYSMTLYLDKGFCCQWKPFSHLSQCKAISPWWISTQSRSRSQRCQCILMPQSPHSPSWAWQWNFVKYINIKYSKHILSFPLKQSLYKHDPFFLHWGLADPLSSHIHHKLKLFL